MTAPIYTVSCNDERTVIKDGHTMFAEDVVKDLRYFQHKIKELEKIEAECGRYFQCHPPLNDPSAMDRNKGTRLRRIFSIPDSPSTSSERSRTE